MNDNKRNINSGDIYYVDLGENRHNIQGGKRPCLILGNADGLKNSNICQVIPITTAKKKSWVPVHMKVFVSVKSTLLIEQIQTVNQEQIDNYVTTVSNDLLLYH